MQVKLDLKLEFVAGSVEAGFRGEMLAEVTAPAPDLTRSFKERQVAVIESVLLAAGDEVAGAFENLQTREAVRQPVVCSGRWRRPSAPPRRPACQ